MPHQFPKGSFEAQVLDELNELKRSLATCQAIHGVSGTPVFLQPALLVSGGAGGGVVGIGVALARLLGWM